MAKYKSSLLYVSTCNSSSTAANAIQVYDQVEGFAAINLEIDLVCFSVQQKQHTFKLKSTNCINLIKVPRLKYLRYIFFSFYVLLHRLRYLNKYSFIYGRHITTMILLSMLYKNRAGIEIHSPPTRIQLYFLGILLRQKKTALFVTTDSLKNHLFKFQIDSYVINDACNPKYWIQEKSLYEPNYILYTGGLFKGKLDLLLLENLAIWCQSKGLKLRLEGDWSKASVELLSLKENYSCIVSSYKYLQKCEIARLQKSAYALLLINPVSGALSMSGVNIDIGLSPLKLFEYLFANRPIISTTHPEIKSFIAKNRQFSSRIYFVKNSMSFDSLLSTLNAIPKTLCDIDESMSKYTYEYRAKLIMEKLK